MSKIAVVSAEGVLCRRATRNSPFRGFQPLPEGMTLVSALSTAYNIAVCAGETEGDEIARWLKDHGMSQYFSYVVPRRPTMPEDGAERFLAQVDHLRSCGFAVGLILDSDPSAVTALLAKGYTALTFSHPEYARPEWRPDDTRGARAWADVVAEQENQARLKADAARPEDSRFEMV